MFQLLNLQVDKDLICLGVKKEQLEPMWKDLNDAGFVSGQAYAKGLRTVKTCVGNTWCRFGTQDAMGMGIAIEKLTWGSWTPHKYKIAVSGCPRNCAEATIKDFGIIGVDSGWEIHVAGNGGIKVRVTDFLCKVKTDEELFEMVKAYMQFYREDAYYLERTAHWIERVGLEYVKEVLFDKKKEKCMQLLLIYHKNQHKLTLGQKPLKMDLQKSLVQ
jgi:nitrite reductase (NADH) large subunit